MKYLLVILLIIMWPILAFCEENHIPKNGIHNNIVFGWNTSFRGLLLEAGGPMFGTNKPIGNYDVFQYGNIGHEISYIDDKLQLSFSLLNYGYGMYIHVYPDPEPIDNYEPYYNSTNSNFTYGINATDWLYGVVYQPYGNFIYWTNWNEEGVGLGLGTQYIRYNGTDFNYWDPFVEIRVKDEENYEHRWTVTTSRHGNTTYYSVKEPHWYILNGFARFHISPNFKISIGFLF